MVSWSQRYHIRHDVPLRAVDWLTCYETWLVLLLLVISYVTRAHEIGLQSMGRFVAVAFPIVVRRMLERLPPPLSALVLILSAFLGVLGALHTAERYGAGSRKFT